MSHNTANQLRSEISWINNNHISKLRSKFICLCNNSCWKNLGRADLVNNISSINLSPIETEALSFRIKFTTGIKKYDMGKIINTNYKNHDSDFRKWLLVGIIAASTNCHFDELTLPNRYITALKSLSSCNIVAEGFRFIYLAFRFSSAENLPLSAWVSYVHHECRCSRARVGCVIHRCQNKNPRWKILPGGCEWTSCTGSVRGGFWGFEKSQGVEFLPREKTVDFGSSPRPCGGCRTWWWWGGGDEKVVI